MTDWAFDILGQRSWDVWSWVCIAASVLMLGRFFTGRQDGATRPISLILSIVAIAGTVMVLAIPALRVAGVGIVWTFLLLALLSTVLYLGAIERLGRRRTALLLALRLAALAALVPMLFAPVIRLARTPAPQRPVLFVVDTSGSMSFPDVQNGPSRFQNAADAIQPLLPDIRRQLLPRFFTFSTNAKEVQQPEDLLHVPADGRATDFVASVTQAIANEPRDGTAVVLISDGTENSNADPAAALAGLGHPVYTVRVGSELTEAAPIANVAVADVQTQGDFAVGQESLVTATILSSALADRVIEVKLAEIDSRGQPAGQVASKKLVLQPTADGQKIELPYTPKTPGVHQLAVWVDPIPGERTVADNRQEFQGLAVDPTIKVLYLEGRLRPEYRELKRLLERDPNIELATLLWVTPEKVAAFGTNQRQPIPARIPDTAGQWKQFDVVILGDVPAARFTLVQQSQLEQFAADGGGLLMLGGQESFGAGGYKGTPIEKALPVFIGDGSNSQETTAFVPLLTASGATHPAMQGLTEWFGTAQTPPARPLPLLNGNSIAAGEKSAAEVLLVHPGRAGPDGRPQIVLAVQRYGKGRSAALTAQSTYQWSLPLYGLGQESPYNAVGQTIRWLANSDIRNRGAGSGIDALVNKNVYRLGETIHLRARARDAHGDATQYAQVTLDISPAGTSTPHQSMSLAPVAFQPGLYDVDLPHPAKGEYSAILIATKDGHELGRSGLKFSVIPPVDEYLKIAANPDLMRRIAAMTHAASYELSQMPDLIQELVRTDPITPRSEGVSLRLSNFASLVPALFGHFTNLPARYDLPMQALIVIPLLAAEWVLRRRWLAG